MPTRVPAAHIPTLHPYNSHYDWSLSYPIPQVGLSSSQGSMFGLSQHSASLPPQHLTKNPMGFPSMFVPDVMMSLSAAVASECWYEYEIFSVWFCSLISNFICESHKNLRVKLWIYNLKKETDTNIPCTHCVHSRHCTVIFISNVVWYDLCCMTNFDTLEPYYYICFQWKNRVVTWWGSCTSISSGGQSCTML